MENEEQLIYTVELNEKNVNEKANVLVATLSQLKKEKAEIEKQNKSGAISTQTYANAINQLNKVERETKKELAAVNKTIDNQEKAAKSASGSLDEMKANLSLATEQYGRFSAEERASSDTAKGFQAAIKKLSDDLKEAEASLGNHTREVGNYGIATRDTNKYLLELIAKAKESGQSLDQMQENVSNLSKAYNSLNKEERENVSLGGNLIKEINSASEALTEQQKVLKTNTSSFEVLDNTFGVFGGQLGGVKDKIGSVISGLEATKVGLTGIKGALAATGIGLFIIALGLLYSFLTKTQTGLDFIEKKTAALGKVMQFLSDKAVAGGKALFEAFDNPKQTLKDLGGFIIDQVINRFKALYEIGAAIVTLDFNRLNNGVIQLGTGVTDASGKIQRFTDEAKKAAAAGEQIAAANIQIRKEESELAAVRAKSRAQIEGLKKIGDDTTKSNAERTAAIQKAYAMENALLQKQQALQLRKIKLMESERAAGKRTAAEQTAINEQYAILFEQQEDSLGKQTEVQNSLNGLREEAKAKAKEAADAAKAAAKEQLQFAADIAQKRVDIATSLGKDTLDLEINLIRKQAAVEKAGYEKSAKLRQLVEIEADAKILALRVKKSAEAASDIAATAKAGLEAQLAFAKAGSSSELRLKLALINANAKAEKAAIEATTVTTKEARAKRDAELALIDVKAKKEALDVETEFVNKLNEKRTEYYEAEKQRIDNLDQKLRDSRNKNLAEEQIRLETQLINIDKLGDADLQSDKKRLETQKKLIQNRRDNELNSATHTKDEIAKINAQADADTEKADDDFIKGRIAKVTQVVDGSMQVFSKLIEANITAQQNALDKQEKAATSSAALSAEQRAAIEKDFQEKRLKLEKEAAKKRKAIATIENIINTAKAITAALPNPVLAILAGITGAAQQVVIESQQFARGGVAGATYTSDKKGTIVNGPGTGTSDSIFARISKGESIINEVSTRKYRNLLSAINQAGGGRAFPDTKATTDIIPNALVSGYAGGGIPAYNEQGIADAIAEAVIEGNKHLPVPIVPVRDVSRLQADRTTLELDNDH